MSKVLITDTHLSDIADAIRNKNGSTTTYTPGQMAAAINAIPTGGGGGSVILQDKTYTPSETGATITYDNGYDGLRKVTVAGITSTYVGSEVTRQGATTIVPSESTQTLSVNQKYMTGNITVAAITSTYVGSGVTKQGAQTITPSTSNQTIAANTYLTGVQTIQGDSDLVASNIKHDVSIFNVTGTFGMKMGAINSAPSSRGTTISFTGLQAQPKYFACNLEFEGSFSSARTIYSVIYDGTTTSNCTSYRSGGSILCYKYTTITWTYNNGTLTLTSPSTSTVGYFQPYNYHFIYFYEE